MKLSTKLFACFAIMIVIAVLYRFIPLPIGIYGFTPVFAIAVFGGAIFRNDKKLAFTLPLVTLFLSDLIFQMLYKAGKWNVPGFYDGQLLNYFLIVLTTYVGFFIKRIKITNVLIAAVAAPSLFYVLSNFSVWATTALYPKTLLGLQTCYIAGLPFYFPWSIVSTVVYIGVLFGTFYAIQNLSWQRAHSISAKNTEI